MRKLLVVLLLAGCAPQMTREQYAANLVAKASPYCEAMGYQPQTEPWRKCVLSVMNTMARQPQRQQPMNCQRFLNGDIACY